MEVFTFTECDWSCFESKRDTASRYSLIINGIGNAKDAFKSVQKNKKRHEHKHTPRTVQHNKIPMQCSGIDGKCSLSNTHRKRNESDTQYVHPLYVHYSI
eukprot:355499_1